MPSISMEKTILQGDFIILDSRFYRNRQPKPGDIIVFRMPDALSIKRVIATGGSSIAGKNGDVFVNGVLLTEPYVSHTGDPSDELINFCSATIRIPG